MRTLLRSSVAAVLAASLAWCIPTSAAAEADHAGELTGGALARFPSFAAIPDSRELNAPPMLTGNVADPGGAGLAGAQVLLSAWPSNDSLRALPVGASFDIIPIARTVSGADGDYILRPLTTSLPAPRTGPDGLDIELDVFHGGRHYVFLSQLKPGRSDNGWTTGLASDTVAGALTPGAGAANALGITLDPRRGELLPPGTPQVRVPVDKPFPGVWRLRWEKVATKYAWTTVAVAEASNGPTIDVLYEKGAETMSSTGFSFDAGVSFSISGARERTNTIKADYVDRTAKRKRAIGRIYQAEMEHGVQRRMCQRGFNGPDYYHQVTTTPYGMTGAYRDAPSRRAPVGCDDKSRRARALLDQVETSGQEAATFGGAFSFVPLGGGAFTGSAQSGYSERVKITFRFRDPERGWWCGYTGKPAHDGQILHGYEK